MTPEHPEGGRELGVSINGKLYINPANKAYMDSLKQSKNPQKINPNTVSHTGFQKKRVIQEPKSEKEIQGERLTLLKIERQRLKVQLQKLDSVIESIEKDLRVS